MLFAIALVLGIAGTALLVLGTCPLPGGKSAKPKAARWAGACWIAFLPVALAVRYLLSFFVLPDNVPMIYVYGVVAAACFFAGVYFLMRPTS